MKKFLFFALGPVFLSCNQNEKKEVPFNEYVFGTWELKQPIPIGEGASFSKCNNSLKMSVVD